MMWFFDDSCLDSKVDFEIYGMVSNKSGNVKFWPSQPGYSKIQTSQEGVKHTEGQSKIVAKILLSNLHTVNFVVLGYMPH